MKFAASTASNHKNSTMNKKAFELAISTLVIIILGILILIAIIIAVTGGFDSLKSATAPFTDTTTATAVKQACQNACNDNSKLIYCCSAYSIDGKDVKCADSRLELGCTLDCTDFDCGNEEE